MTTEATLTTRTIGEAESALNGLLDTVLDGTGIDELGWVALRLVSSMPPPVTAARLSTQLRMSKKVDELRVEEALSKLEDVGMIQRVGDTVATTPEGASRFEKMTAEVGRFIAQMWEGLDHPELATAARVLTTITQRANELLAIAASSHELSHRGSMRSRRATTVAMSSRRPRRR